MKGGSDLCTAMMALASVRTMFGDDKIDLAGKVITGDPLSLGHWLNQSNKQEPSNFARDGRSSGGDTDQGYPIEKSKSELGCRVAQSLTDDTRIS